MLIPWITTRSFIIDLVPSWNKTSGEQDWSLGRVTVDLGKVHEELASLVDELNADQWEIKHITPLEKGVTYHEQQKVMQSSRARMSESVLGAFGLGWGTQVTSGYIILAQRTEYLSEKEYAERKTAPKAAPVRSNAEIAALSHELKSIKGVDAIQVRKLGLLRGEKFAFQGVEYATQVEAENAQAQAIAALDSKLAKLLSK